MDTGAKMVKQLDNPRGTYSFQQIAPWVLRASPILAGFMVAFFAVVDRSLGSGEGIALLTVQFILYAAGIYLCFPRKHGAKNHKSSTAIVR